MSINHTRAVFEATASTYDRGRSLLIPGCDAFYRWAVELIPSGSKTILDLGAGSGMLSAMVRERFPEAHIHLMDFSEAMLDLARERMKGDRNVSFHQGDYLTEPLPVEICAVVSSLSVHHLENDRKRELFRRVFTALKPRGAFVNADQVAGPTEEVEARHKAWWLAEVRAAGASEEQIRESLFRQEQDRCSTVESQLEWMREAGFADVDCWYKHGRFAVMAGSK